MRGGGGLKLYDPFLVKGCRSRSYDWIRHNGHVLRENLKTPPLFLDLNPHLYHINIHIIFRFRYRLCQEKGSDQLIVYRGIDR